MVTNFNNNKEACIEFREVLELNFQEIREIRCKLTF